MLKRRHLVSSSLIFFYICSGKGLMGHTLRRDINYEETELHHFLQLTYLEADFHTFLDEIKRIHEGNREKMKRVN